MTQLKNSVASTLTELSTNYKAARYEICTDPMIEHFQWERRCSCVSSSKEGILPLDQSLQVCCFSPCGRHLWHSERWSGCQPPLPHPHPPVRYYLCGSSEGWEHKSVFLLCFKFIWGNPFIGTEKKQEPCWEFKVWGIFQARGLDSAQHGRNFHFIF